MFPGLALGALSSGCAEEGESVIILGMPEFEKGEEGKGASCSAKAGGEVWLAKASVDLSFDTGLVIPIEFQNNLATVNAEGSNLGLDSSELQQESASVSMRVPQAPAVENFVRAAGEAFLDFKVPLPANSVPGGKSRKVVFVEIPRHVLVKFREAFAQGGYLDGSELIIETKIRVRFKLAAGRKTLESRSFNVPVYAGLNNLRRCVPTLWTNPSTKMTVNLCTDMHCRSNKVYSNSICGNAQMALQLPRCCDGADVAAKDNEALPVVCGAVASLPKKEGT